MVTFFCAPRAFIGDYKRIQLNAIGSWICLPGNEVILLGNEFGVAEVAENYHLVHYSNIRCNEFGTPLVNGLFSLADEKASNDFLVYANADIIFTSGLIKALIRVIERQTRRKRDFLLMGRTLDMKIDYEIDFQEPVWDTHLIKSAKRNGRYRKGRDYFVFRRGFWGEMPAFAVGRPAWDNWAVFRALELGADVIDITKIVPAIHQNHNFKENEIDGPIYKNRWAGPEAKRNICLAGEWAVQFETGDASWKMYEKIFIPVLSRRRLAKSILKHLLNQPKKFLIISRLIQLLLFPENLIRGLRKKIISGDTAK